MCCGYPDRLDWEDYSKADPGSYFRLADGMEDIERIIEFMEPRSISCHTEPGTGLGGDYRAELAVMANLLDQFRAHAHTVYFTTFAYEPHLRDGGQFVATVPALSILVKGSEWVEVDKRVRPRPSERVVLKKYASAYFDARLGMELQGLGVDTVIIVGCATSGCSGRAWRPPGVPDD